MGAEWIALKSKVVESFQISNMGGRRRGHVLPFLALPRTFSIAHSCPRSPLSKSAFSSLLIEVHAHMHAGEDTGVDTATRVEDEGIEVCLDLSFVSCMYAHPSLLCLLQMRSGS